MEVIEKNIKFEDLVEADEAFFTGTAVEITPITSLNGKLINKGKRGKITQQLQEKFQEIISGNNAAYDNWLTYTR
jgi:branched-chain amino acid aminotransferase